jgi:hypothetical protein
MKLKMNPYTESMVSFFECLCRHVRPQFAKVKEKKRQRHILEVMQEYGFAKYDSRKKTWVGTRQLVGKIIKINRVTRDHHTSSARCFQKGIDRIFRDGDYLDPNDNWHYFQLLLPIIFETQYMHCIRWLRLNIRLHDEKSKFSQEALLIARGFLFAGVMNVCIAETNATLDKFSKSGDYDDDDNDDDDDDDDSPLRPSPVAASIGATTTSSQQQSVIQSPNIVAFPKPNQTTPS